MRVGKIVASGFAIATVLVGGFAVAAAETPHNEGPPQPPTATTVVVEAGAPGQTVRQPSGGGGGVGPVCWVDTDFEGIETGALGWFVGAAPDPRYAIGVQHCVRSDGTETRQVVVYDTTAPPPPPDATVLANQVRAELPLQLDPPQTAPPDRAITGLPTWVWVNAGQFRTITASRTAGPLTVTVTATPAELRIDPGDGHRESCTGAGVPWHTGAHATEPGACTHTYTDTSAGQPGGRYALTVTASWQIAWTASNGQAGTLPPVQLANRTQLTVQQVQPVLDP